MANAAYTRFEKFRRNLVSGKEQHIYRQIAFLTIFLQLQALNQVILTKSQSFTQHIRPALSQLPNGGGDENKMQIRILGRAHVSTNYVKQYTTE